MSATKNVQSPANGMSHANIDPQYSPSCSLSSSRHENLLLLPEKTASAATYMVTRSLNSSCRKNLEPEKKLKRMYIHESAEKHSVVSGRALKRLRLDHHRTGEEQSHSSLSPYNRYNSSVSAYENRTIHNNVRMSGAEEMASTFNRLSTESLSVGTISGDLESNDDDDGDYNDDDGNDDRGAVESVASSWVASLPSIESLNLRRRRKDYTWDYSKVDIDTSSNAAGLSEGGKVPVLPPHSLQQQITNYKNHVDDDATTFSEITTAAVAPRKQNWKRALRMAKNDREGTENERTYAVKSKKRRAFGSMTINPLMLNHRATSYIPSAPHLTSDEGMDDFLVEEIEVDSNFKDDKDLKTVSSFLEADTRGTITSAHRTLSPPIECIPHPLLVAAQHAAGGGTEIGSRIFTKRGMALNHDAIGQSTKGSLFLTADYYSSVTEEEISLAEDEASLSAVSIGGNTTTSFGGETAASSHGEGRKSQCLANSLQKSDAQVSRSEYKSIGTSLAELKSKAALQLHSPCMRSHCQRNSSSKLPHPEKLVSISKSEPALEVNYFNHLLGGLHRDRQSRQSRASFSMHHKRESSLHSLTSTDTKSKGASSHRSCPNHVTYSLLRPQDYNSEHPSTATIKGYSNYPVDTLTTNSKMDVEMEEAVFPSHNIGSLGLTLSSFSIPDSNLTSMIESSSATHVSATAESYAKHTSSTVSKTVKGQESLGIEIPKWKRQINLPSHSSLF